MAYRVLARAYRSRTFTEVVGQETIATTLTNAVASERVHHGYLFTGTRGVGKTSMARILAKALNCQAFDAPTPTPCCECDSCVAISEGEDVDVVEIDAASNTGVDNIRELRGNATLRPARSRFKVYIIDEVHMLSTGAFNALLKTLEEPPSHVKFILATTEAHKVPATIQSRCQRFDFRAIDAASIAKHLATIAESEKIRVDEDVLRRIGRLASGSMRDALSLLDKLVSYESEHLTSAIVDELIPPPHDELASAVIECIASQDAAGALRAFDVALQTGRTVERFCDQLVEHVRTLMLMRVCGEDTDLADVSESMRSTLATQSERFDAPTYVYMITLLEELRRNAKFSGAARALADAAIVRLAMSGQFSDLGELIARLETGDDLSRPAQDVKKNGGERPRPNETARRTVASPPPVASAAVNEPASQALDPDNGESASNDREPETSTRPTARVSSDERQRVANHPLVQKVKEAVDGTLRDVRRVQRPGADGAKNEEPCDPSGVGRE